MDIRVKITRDGSNAIKTMDIEEYLRGVVPSEMSSSWPLEALKAQAVAARTYAMGHITSSRTYDVDDTVKYQAYHANRTRKRSDEAIAATAGETLLYKGSLAQTVYCASNGGKTVSAKQKWKNDIPYLIAKTDPYDKASGEKKNGHGVGMSQHGARQAALQGKTYVDILEFYYPGCELSKEANATVKVMPKKVKTNGGNLNVRVGAGTEYSVTDTLANGETVLAKEVSGDWTHIAFFTESGASDGWVSNGYLEDYADGD